MLSLYTRNSNLGYEIDVLWIKLFVFLFVPVLVAYHLHCCRRSHAFKQDTERVVNELKSSAHWVVDKLDKIEQQSDSLLEHSNEIHNSLDSIESQANCWLKIQRL